MRGAFTFLAAICAVAFVIAAPIAVLAFQADRDFLSASSWREAFEETHAYDNVAPYVAAGLRRAPDSPFASASDAQLETLARELVPAEVVRPVFEDIIDQFELYVRAERDDISVSMVAFKAQMIERMPQAVNLMLAGTPVCASRSDYGSFTCRPRPEDESEFLSRGREAAERAWGRLPDNYEFPVAGETPSARQREIHRGVINVIRVAPYIAGGLLLLVGLLAVRGPRGLLLWVGMPVLVGGLLTLAAWGIASAGIAEGMREMHAHTDPANAGALLAAPALEHVVGECMRGVLLIAGVMSVVGAGMSIAGLLAPSSDEA